MAKRRTSILKERLIRLEGQSEIVKKIGEEFKFRNQGEQRRFDRVVQDVDTRIREIRFLIEGELPHDDRG